MGFELTAEDLSTITELSSPKEETVSETPITETVSETPQVETAPAAENEGEAVENEVQSDPTPTTETPDVKQPTSKAAKQFNALARKAKEIADKSRIHKQELEELKELRKLKELKAKAKADPLAVLSEFGLSYHEITDRIVHNAEANPVDPVQNEVEQLRSEINGLKQSLTQREQQAQVAAYRSRVADTINSSEEFEFIQAQGAQGADYVLNAVANHFASTGETLSVREACEAVEQYFENEVSKYQNLKKVQKRFQPVAPKNQPIAQVKAAQTKTLSNSNTGSAIAHEKREETFEEAALRVLQEMER